MLSRLFGVYLPELCREVEGLLARGRRLAAHQLGLVGGMPREAVHVAVRRAPVQQRPLVGAQGLR